MYINVKKVKIAIRSKNNVHFFNKNIKLSLFTRIKNLLLFYILLHYLSTFYKSMV